MSYSRGLVAEDINRLKFLFSSLCKIFEEQEINDDLLKKSVTLFEAFIKMIDEYASRPYFGDVHDRILLELWLEELLDAVSNTEDLVDKIHTEALRHKLDGQICEKMEDIRCCLESYVKQEMQYRYEVFRFCNAGLRVSFVADPVENFVDEPEVFGMDCDKEEIIKLLLPDDANDKQLSVISIEGNGQIGKTTLARLVYNDQRVTDYFDRKAWTRVPFDFNSVTRSILNFLAFQDKNLKVEYNDPGFQLQNRLKGERFLLVLDGAQETTSSKGWEALRYALKDAANGSCVIVTTRNKDIAPMMDAVAYPMKPLSEEEIWSLFAKFAFRDQNPTPDAQLEVIGKEIVQMCHGRPSLVRILGSLLRFKLQRKEWEAMLERLTRLTHSSDLRENVNDVPDLRLPEHLKRCLAFCSIFPQDYEFVKDKLLLLWVAGVYLEWDNHYDPLKEADRSFDKLKPFFQESSGNESSFLMRMNNLAAHVSTRYCFRLEDNHPSHIPLNTRHLSLVGGKYENSVIFEAIDRTKHLRTFLALDHESRHLCTTELQNLLSKLQFLRVLSLSHYHITEIPDSIGNLEHLRYIDLSHTPIKRLPESVCQLYNLQSLILSNCHSLTELPGNTSKLKNLINLDVSGSGLIEMPNGMSKLDRLKLLSFFVVGKAEGGSALEELKDIKLVGTLHISKLQNVAFRYYADGAMLCDKCLHELVLEWDENAADPKNATEVLEGLKPNGKYLAKLTINFYNGTQFPKWFKWWKFDNIFFLRLSNCKNCSSLPSLRNLPSLRDLIIECMDAVEEVGPDFSSAETSTWKKAEFKSLEILTFEGMSKWTKWVPLDELPSLKQLCIRRCPKLRGNLPKELPSVERVEISASQELMTALSTEASLNNLHYHEKIVFISDDKVTSYASECATGSSSLMIEGEDIEKLKETEESDGIEEETNVEIQNPFVYPFLEEISSLPLPQRTAECSLLVTPDMADLPEEMEIDEKQSPRMIVDPSVVDEDFEIALDTDSEFIKEADEDCKSWEVSKIPSNGVSKSELLQYLSTLLLAQPFSERHIRINIFEDAFKKLHLLSNYGEPFDLPLPKNIRTLTNFVVGKESSTTIKKLGLFSHLHGTLRLSKLQNVVFPKDAAEARLDEMAQLDELVLEWDNDDVDPENDRIVLQQLEPHTNLKELSISFYHGTRFPSWLESGILFNISFLSLCNCKNCLNLPCLGLLPSLKELVIEGLDAVKMVGPEFSGIYEPFKSLETLTFVEMLEWEEWVSSEIGGKEFPCLQELCIRRCPKLKGNLPKQLPSVMIVVISESQELLNTLVKEVSLNKRHLKYYDKIVFIIDEHVASFLDKRSVLTYGGATEFSLPTTQVAPESSLRVTRVAAESSFYMIQDGMETSSHITQIANIRDEADAPTNSWSNRDELQDLSSFKSMKVSEISELMEVTGLHSLKIEECDALEFIPEEVMDGNPSLQHLYIINCCSLKSFPLGHPLTALKILYIQNCKKLEFLTPAKREHQFALEHLCIGSSCDSMIVLPLHLFLNLRSLSIWNCANLESLTITEGIQEKLMFLEALEIRDCPKLLSFPKGGLPTPNLSSILISNCKNLVKLPDQLHTLGSLRSMFINSCPELVSLPEGGLPFILSLLCITSCEKLNLGSEWGLHKLNYLRQLEIEGGCKNVKSFTEDNILLPCNLSSLRISRLLNLRDLNGLQHLTALKTLEISCCNKLQSLAEEGLPSSLSSLCIEDCSLLIPKHPNKRKRLV